MPSERINILSDLYVAYQFESLSVTDSAVGFDTNKIDDGTELAKRVIISVDTAQIRWTMDGTTPTTTVGHLANRFDIIVITGTFNIKNFKAIRTGATSATLDTTFLR